MEEEGRLGIAKGYVLFWAPQKRACMFVVLRVQGHFRKFGVLHCHLFFIIILYKLFGVQVPASCRRSSSLSRCGRSPRRSPRPSRRFGASSENRSDPLGCGSACHVDTGRNPYLSFTLIRIQLITLIRISIHNTASRAPF